MELNNVWVKSNKKKENYKVSTVNSKGGQVINLLFVKNISWDHVSCHKKNWIPDLLSVLVIIEYKKNQEAYKQASHTYIYVFQFLTSHFY